MVTTFYQTGPNGLFIFYQVFNLILQSAIICFSVSGETTELIELLNNFTNDEDTTLISITGHINSTISRMSRYSLTYHEKEYRINRYYDLSSQIPAMYIIEALVRSLRNQEI